MDTNISPDIVLQPITDNDLPLLFEIYASTRQEEMEMVHHWSQQEKQAFLQQQFVAQHQYYKDRYTGATFAMIYWKNKPAGRWYVHPHFAHDEIRIMDIALLPAFRNKGIGSTLINNLLQQAQEKGKRVTIHVEFNNPAQRLYHRLGFSKIGEFNSVYHLLQWLPVSIPQQ